MLGKGGISVLQTSIFKFKFAASNLVWVYSVGLMYAYEMVSLEIIRKISGIKELLMWAVQTNSFIMATYVMLQ